MPNLKGSAWDNTVLWGKWQDPGEKERETYKEKIKCSSQTIAHLASPLGRAFLNALKKKYYQCPGRKLCTYLFLYSFDSYMDEANLFLKLQMSVPLP